MDEAQKEYIEAQATSVKMPTSKDVFDELLANTKIAIESVDAALVVLGSGTAVDIGKALEHMLQANRALVVAMLGVGNIIGEARTLAYLRQLQATRSADQSSMSVN